MSQSNSPARCLRFVVSLLFMLTGVSFSQSASSTPKDDQIPMLVKTLCDHAAPPQELLDPELSPKERQKTVSLLRDPAFQLTIVAAGPPSAGRDGLVSVPARIHFRNSTSEVEGDTTLRFVQRNGKWYFADFDFLRWSPSDVVTLLGVLVVAVLFAAGVLILRRRLLRQNMLNGSNLIKIFIPIFWPRLFADTRSKVS